MELNQLADLSLDPRYADIFDKLDYPNEEVKSSFANSLLKQYLQISSDNSVSAINKLTDAIFDGNVEDLINTLKQFFASIPYDIIKDTENYYQTVIHLIFSMLGFNCRSEVRICAGRIDTLVETKKFIYCFEFKLNGTAEEALAQIDSKEYMLPWELPVSPSGETSRTDCGKKLFKIGVSFDTEKRNIGSWKIA